MQVTIDLPDDPIFNQKAIAEALAGRRTAEAMIVKREIAKRLWLETDLSVSAIGRRLGMAPGSARLDKGAFKFD